LMERARDPVATSVSGIAIPVIASRSRSSCIESQARRNSVEFDKNVSPVRRVG
jgi:hypothetical protein